MKRTLFALLFALLFVLPILLPIVRVAPVPCAAGAPVCGPVYPPHAAH